MKFLVLSIGMIFYSMSAMAGTAQTYKLANGLDVVMVPDATTPLLSAVVVVRAGSSLEDEATSGSTHLLEHMIFRGTEEHSQGEIYDALDMMGAYYNAQTTKTYTTFILVVPKEHAEDAMEIQAEMILQSTIPADTFDVEKGRVLAEIQQSLQRSSYHSDLAHSRNLYGEDPYSIPTLGTLESIEKLDRDHVFQFYKKWYAVNNMTLVLRGDFDQAGMANLAETIYGRFNHVTLPPRKISQPEGLLSENRGHLLIEPAEVKSGLLKISFDAPRLFSEDYFRYRALTSLLDQRLDDLSRGVLAGKITYIYSDMTSDPAFSVMTITAGLLPMSDPEEITGVILNSLQSFSGEEFTGEQLERTIKASEYDELFFAEQVQYGTFLLVPKLALAPYEYWVMGEQNLEINPGVFWDCARQWFTNRPWIATAVLPQSQQAEFRSVPIDTWSNAVYVPLNEKEKNTILSEYNSRYENYPTGLLWKGGKGKKEKTAGVSMGKIAQKTLDNGLVLAVRSLEGVPVAAIHVVVRNRAMMEGEDRRGWADLLHRLLLKSGTDSMDRDQVEKYMDDLGIRISVVDDPRVPMDNYRTTPEYSYIRVEAVAEHWQEAMNLLADLFKADQLTPEMVQEAAEDLKGIIRSNGKSLSTITRSELNSLLYGDHPLTKPVYGDGESLEEIDIDALKAFRRQYFSPENLVVTALTPAKNKTVFRAAKKAFSGLKKESLPKIKTVKPVFSPGEKEVSGTGRQGYLAMGFLIPELPDGDLAPLLTANSIISDLIYRDLGENKGWAYGAGSSLVMRNGWGAWRSTMGLPDDKLMESKQIVLEYIDRVVTGKFDEKKFEIAKQSVMGSMLRRYSSRINLAMAMGVDLFQFDDPDFTWKLYRSLQETTPEEVKIAAKKYLNAEEGMAIVIGHPEKQEEKSKMRMPPPGMGGMGH